jgi:predicted translin family RNA/ssDNA-binding protein
MNDFDQDNQFRDEFLWLEREQGRASKETKADKVSKVERELTKRVERLESKLKDIERKLKRSEDTFKADKSQGDSKGTKEASEPRLDAINEECRVRQADGYRTSFGEGIL